MLLKTPRAIQHFHRLSISFAELVGGKNFDLFQVQCWVMHQVRFAASNMLNGSTVKWLVLLQWLVPIYDDT